MSAIFLAMMKYGPMLFSFIQSAQTFVTAVGTQATGPAKLAAVTAAIVKAAPEIGALVQADPTHSNHLQDYINGSVALMKSLNASASDAPSGA